MNAEVLSPAGLSAADVDRWRELAAAALEPNPFFEPEMVLPAARLYESTDVGLLVSSENGDWHGLLPVVRVRRWHRVPAVGLAGWRHSYALLGTPLVRPEAAERSLSAMIDRGLRGPTTFLGLDVSSTDGPVNSALLAALGSGRTTELRAFERATLERRESGEYLALKPKRMRELRRQRRKLGEELGAEVEADEDAGSSAAVERFMELEASGWKGREGTAFAELGRHDEFFRELCRGFAELGRLELLGLRAGDRTVAMMCSMRSPDQAALFTFKIAYDEAWSQFSPGILLECDIAERFHADPQLMWMDSCADPDNEMINRLWPDRRALTTVALTKGPLGIVSRGTFRAARAAREKLKGSE